MYALLITPLPMTATAQLSDHNGSELQSYGLGMSYPQAINVSQDLNWRVYVFERDGVSYYQVNDLAGRVQVIVGRVDDAFWTLPAGVEASRLSLPSRRIPLPGSTVKSLVYRHPEFSLLRYVVENEAVWSIESSDVSR
jgi:hypothetical protein